MARVGHWGGVAARGEVFTCASFWFEAGREEGCFAPTPEAGQKNPPLLSLSAAEIMLAMLALNFFYLLACAIIVSVVVALFGGRDEK